VNTAIIYERIHVIWQSVNFDSNPLKKILSSFLNLGEYGHNLLMSVFMQFNNLLTSILEKINI
jgi:hypothetical protein